MQRGNVNDLMAFVAVGRERSFTRVAARLGVSQSRRGHAIRGLEAGLGVRVLTRATRGVSPTEVGERLLHSVSPRLENIEAELEAVSELRGKPAGTVRITFVDYMVDTLPLAKAHQAAAGISGYPGRDHRQLWPHRHRRVAPTRVCVTAGRWRRI